MHTKTRLPNKRLHLGRGLVSLAVVLASCSSASEEDSSAGPEYGASLSEFRDATQTIDDSVPSPRSEPPYGFTEIQWEDLIPPGSSSAEISARFNQQMVGVEPGSAQADEILADLQAEFENQPANPELEGMTIQLTGFIAPLTYSGDLITEFLLVPYFGACIHVPAPPPNQTVVVRLQDGQSLTIEDSWGPVWVTGTMTIDGATTDLATASYTISGAQAGVANGY